MSAPAPAPVGVVTPCRGNYVITIREPFGDLVVVDCPGCDDCDREIVAARMPAMTSERAFALLPTIDEEPF